MQSLIRTPDVHIGDSEQTIACIKTELWRLKCKSVLIVSDPGVVASGAVRFIRESLEDSSVRVRLFCDVKPTPTVENVRAGVKELRRSQACAIVAIGGGSVIDAAKMIGIAYANTQFAHITNLEGSPRTRIAPPFLIAVPTTFSPASSSARFVAYDRASQRQFCGFDEHALPQVVCVNTESLATIPDVLASQTASEALVALLDARIACARRNEDGRGRAEGRSDSALESDGCASAETSSANSPLDRATRMLVERSLHDFADFAVAIAQGKQEAWVTEGMCEISIVAGSLNDQIAVQSDTHRAHGLLQAIARALSTRYAMPYGCACERVMRHAEDVYPAQRTDGDRSLIASIVSAAAGLPAQRFPFVVSDEDVDALVHHIVLDLSVDEDDEKAVSWLRFACSLLIKEH